MTTTAEHEEHWDTRYQERDRIWSGQPNVALVREVTGVTPGHALDLGCGEGADAVWLARQGWRVTAVDVSRVALERGAEEARRAGVADRVEFRWHDLATGVPAGEYDLVSAQYLHSVLELPREEILRAAARAVVPGGILLVTGHTHLPAGHEHEHPEHLHFPTPEEVHDSLDLPEGAWEVLRSEEFDRIQQVPDDRPIPRKDNVLALRRLR
jgi:SAM-dependent methyltransferase